MGRRDRFAVRLAEVRPDLSYEAALVLIRREHEMSPDESFHQTAQRLIDSAAADTDTD
jgi:hypothetical protein